MFWGFFDTGVCHASGLYRAKVTGKVYNSVPDHAFKALLGGFEW